MVPQENAQWTPHRIDAVTALIDDNFRQSRDDIGAFAIEELKPMYATVRMPISALSIRPGGSVSGPTMVKLADISAYIAILSERGPRAIDAVTATLTINFLARPAPADLIGKARLLRLGRRLAMCECEIYSDGAADMVAHSTLSYAMPLG